MITFPPEFAPIWFSGYFWNTENHQLYSLKVDGVLKPLKMVKPNPFNHLNESGYRVSIKGERKFIPLSRLKKLTNSDQYEIPVRK